MSDIAPASRRTRLSDKGDEVKVIGCCPLCEKRIVVKDNLAADPIRELNLHLAGHTLKDWIAGTTRMRTQLDSLGQCAQLRETPHWAMPRA